MEKTNYRHGNKKENGSETNKMFYTETLIIHNADLLTARMITRSTISGGASRYKTKKATSCSHQHWEVILLPERHCVEFWSSRKNGCCIRLKIIQTFSTVQFHPTLVQIKLYFIHVFISNSIQYRAVT